MNCELYPKLDAFMVSKRVESKGILIYWCSSNQFKTAKNFKLYLSRKQEWKHLTFKVMKG